MADNVQVVRNYAINLQVAKSIQQNLKAIHEDVEPEQQKLQDYLDKQISARVATQVTARMPGFGD